MKVFFRLASAVVFTFMLVAVASTIGKTQHVIDESQSPSFLFTISATSGSFEDGQLTLTGVPLVVYFSDRPARIAGHISLQDFATMWSKGANSFAMDAPNAQLSILGQSPGTQAIVTLSDLEISGTSATFRVETLDGTIPGTFGQATLFLDDTPTCPPGVNPQCTD